MLTRYVLSKFGLSCSQNSLSLPALGASSLFILSAFQIPSSTRSPHFPSSQFIGHGQISFLLYIHPSVPCPSPTLIQSFTKSHLEKIQQSTYSKSAPMRLIVPKEKLILLVVFTLNSYPGISKWVLNAVRQTSDNFSARSLTLSWLWLFSTFLP